MTEKVVVDSNLVVKWLVLVRDSALADELQTQWDSQGIELLAPSLLFFELTNVHHKYVRRGVLSDLSAIELLDRMRAFDITLVHDLSLYRRALQLASELGQGAAYDSHYLALAENVDCEFWTADRRFYRAALPHFDRVRWLGEVALS